MRPKNQFAYQINMSVHGTASSAGRRLGHEAARVAVRETLSRISESGESAAKSTASDPLIENKSLEAKAKDTCRMLAESKVAVVSIVFLFTFILLCALNPPMAQTREKPGDTSRSWKKIVGWSSVTALLALLIPLVKKTE